ncbi:hypothetical protein KAU39_07400 [bacterium]|nr:hypothetical protein [bacterium]
MAQSLRNVSIQKPKHLPKLIGRMQLADLMDLKEIEFKELIRHIEHSSLFKKLAYPATFKDKKEKVISFVKFPKTKITRAYELKEEILADKTEVSIESLLEGREDIIKVIKHLGIAKFRKYFLDCRDNLSLEEIAEECSMKIEKVSEIIDLVNEISIQSSFTTPVKTDPSNRVFYSKVASIEKEEDGFSLGYFDFCYVKGKYSINYEKLAQLKKEGKFTSKQIKELDNLTKTMELINSRRNTLYQILQEIIKKQNKFLLSGNKKDRKSLTQKEIAQIIKKDSSLVCRAIKFKSVELPQGKEMPLKDFFPDRKTIIKEFLQEILAENNKKFTDIQLTDLVKKQFRINLSRRSINNYRREINSD